LLEHSFKVLFSIFHIKKFGDLFPQKLVRLVEFTQEKRDILGTQILRRKILLGLPSTNFFGCPSQETMYLCVIVDEG